MRRLKMAVCATLMLGLTTDEAQAAAQQSDPLVNRPSAQSALLSATPVIGQPFSATKYVRTVKTLADGKRVTVNESHNVKVARDSDGRVRVEAPPGSEYQTGWPSKFVVVLDPVAHTIHYWLEGGRAAKVSAVIPLTAAQMKDLEAPQAASHESTSQAGSEQPSVTTEDLGQQVIEGVPVTGVRTTTMLPPGFSGKDAPIATSREVWTSAEMKLVMKVVTVDPRIGETTSGLEDFSRQPDAALFRPPEGYSVQHSRQRTPVEDRLKILAEGVVK